MREELFPGRQIRQRLKLVHGQHFAFKHAALDLQATESRVKSVISLAGATKSSPLKAMAVGPFKYAPARPSPLPSPPARRGCFSPPRTPPRPPAAGGEFRWCLHVRPTVVGQYDGAAPFQLLPDLSDGGDFFGARFRSAHTLTSFPQDKASKEAAH